MINKIRVDDLRANRVLYKFIDQELKKIVSNNQGIYDMQNYKTEIESLFSKYINLKFSKFVDSGTTALQLALHILEIKQGDEVIVPVVTNASTALAPLCLGATPVFIDIKEDFTIDELKIEEVITENTKAIIPVHMFGHACNMEKIIEISNKHNLKIIEDVCQAHGTTHNNKKLGTFGDIATFSFDPHKTISTIGVGGAISFNDEQFLKKIDDATNVDKGMPDLAQGKRFPARMSVMDMAVLKMKIKSASAIENNKIKNQKEYEERLESMGNIKLFKDTPNQKTVRQFYHIWAENRGELFIHLKNNNIYCKMPNTPLNKLPVFSKFDKNNYPVSERFYKESISLPLFPFMKSEEVEIVCSKIKEFYSKL